MRSALMMGLLCAAMLVSGCGRAHFVKTGEENPSPDEPRDYMECLYEAQKATGNLSEENDDREDRIEEMVDNCMGLKGYVED